MTLFFYSSRYTLECFLPNIYKIYKNRIEKIYIYQDAFMDSKFFDDSECPIIFESNLSVALLNSDISITLDDGRISKKFSRKIEELTCKIGKKHYQIALSSDDTYYKHIPFEDDLLHSKTSMLICCDGEASQVEKIELSLNMLFKNDKISIKQFLSFPSQTIIDKLSIIINDKTVVKGEESQFKQTEYDVLIVTISLNHLLSNNVEVYNDIILLQPDFVLFCGEHNYRNFNDLKNVFKYKYNKEIDLILLSNFFLYKEQLGDIGTRVKSSLAHNFIMQPEVISYDNSAETKVYRSIISKITFPGAVKVLNKRNQ